MAMTGVKIQQVPYRGTTQMLPDLLGGRLNLFFGNISNVLPLVREGKLRAFAITSRKRSPQIPELPTMEELGFPGLRRHRLVRPDGAGRHAEADRRQDSRRDRQGHGACRTCARKLEGLGLQLVGNTPAEFAEIVKKEMPMWGKVIKDAGIKPAQ